MAKKSETFGRSSMEQATTIDESKAVQIKTFEEQAVNSAMAADSKMASKMSKSSAKLALLQSMK